MKKKELSEQENVSPPTSSTQGTNLGVRLRTPRPYSHEELMVPKVNQLSTSSQLGECSTLPEAHGEAQQRPVQLGVKRCLNEPLLPRKRPRLEDSTAKEALEGGVPCSPASDQGIGSSYSCRPTEPKGSNEGLSPSSPPLSLSHGLASREKTPSTNGHRPLSGDRCPTKKRLRLPSDTGESCSQDEGPPPSKRIRLSFEDPGLGPASCCSTDAKAAPYCNQLSTSSQLGECSTSPEAHGEAQQRPVRLGVKRRLNEPLLPRKQPRLEDSTEKEALEGGVTCSPASCCSTDATAAPYCNHLQQSEQDRPKTATDLLRLWRQPKTGLEFTSEQVHSSSHTVTHSQTARSSRPPTSISRSLLVNFEESMLKGRFPPTSQIKGFKSRICTNSNFPKPLILPMQVTFYNMSDNGAVAPFLGVISLESRGKNGYGIPYTGTIGVALCDPQKKVFKNFLVPYNLSDMPPNHMTFLRHRSFRVATKDGKKSLHSLIHLRFQSSRSRQIYLHSDIRLLFHPKSIKVYTGSSYELTSSTEMPRNPSYSPRM